MTRQVLAIDLGTTGIKTAVVDESGSVLSTASEIIPSLFTVDGGVEQDPNAWWSAIGRCAREAVSRSGVAAEDVTLVAVTSQFSSTVAVADDGSAIANAIMWMDQRGRLHTPARGRPETVQAWIDIHGMVPSANDDIGHVWFIRHERPDVYEAAHAFVEPMDHLAARLTGVVTATQSTMFPMLAVDNRTWGATTYSDALLAMSQLDPARLPTLVPLGEPRGRITTAAAEHIGVSPRALVMDATIDSVTTAVGTGAIDSSRCGIVLGTTTVMATHVDSKRHDMVHGLTSAPSPVTNMHFLVAENGIGGKALDVFVNNIVYPDDGLGLAAPHDAFDRVLSVAAHSPIGASGVLFLPWLVGSMAPGLQRRVRGGFVNLDLSSTRGDMARAVLEGVALNAAWLLPYFSALAGQPHTEITVGGGGASSPLWGQILADAFGVSVRRLANPRVTTAHGAALLALVQSGAATMDDIPAMLVTAEVHEPDVVAHDTYQRLLEAFVEFHEQSVPFYARLAGGDQVRSRH